MSGSAAISGRVRDLSASSQVAPELLNVLRCPYDRTPLTAKAERLNCQSNHAFPVIEGIPVLLRSDEPETLWVAGASWERANLWVDGKDRSDPRFIATLGLGEAERASLVATVQQAPKNGVDAVISHMVLATSGYLYESVLGNLSKIPIPHLRLEAGQGALLDIGCNWGRWTVAAAAKGYRAFGIDPSIGALLTAKRLAEKLGLSCQFVCGDGRFLPFAPNTFSKVFSYSVLQHLSETDATTCLKEVGRVLEPEGVSFVQMPNGRGIRSFYHLWRRGFKPATGFDVRYWTPKELIRVFNETIGKSQLSVDGFLGLGIQPSDFKILPWKSKIVILVSETLRAITQVFPPLKQVADSLYVRSVRRS